MSEYYFNPDLQRHQIIEYNSPILTIADQFKIMTQLENNLMEAILGVRVQREKSGSPASTSASLRCWIEALSHRPDALISFSVIVLDRNTSR